MEVILVHDVARGVESQPSIDDLHNSLNVHGRTGIRSSKLWRPEKQKGASLFQKIRRRFIMHNRRSWLVSFRPPSLAEDLELWIYRGSCVHVLVVRSMSMILSTKHLLPRHL